MNPQLPGVPPKGVHSITLADAIAMTTLYRNNRISILKPELATSDVLALNETFNKEDVMQMISEPGCVAMRIYYGMTPDLQVHAILVGVDENNEDILPAAMKRIDDYAQILEEATRCPYNCPPSSPLNT